jgi:hypothetical protein
MRLLPFQGDTRRTRWLKILLYWQQNLGNPAHASNNPRDGDSLRMILVKLLRAIQNISG